MTRALLLIALMLTASLPLSAAEPTAAPLPKFPFAVVDMQRVMKDSKAAQSIQKQLEAQRAVFQQQIANEEKNLTEAQANLQESQKTLSPDAFEAKKRDLQRTFLSVEREVQERRRALDNGFNDAMGKVREKLLAIIDAHAREQQLALVAPKQQMLWQAPSLDLTDAVVAKLNQDLPDVTVKIDLPKDERGDSPETAQPPLLKK